MTNSLGYCPKCNAPGKSREKRPNGNDKCENGHTYPSRDALHTTKTQSEACNCMGPKNGEPYCPCMMNRLGIFKRDGQWIEPEKIVGAVKDKEKFCIDWHHNPPMGLYVAPGETYVHVCPSCGESRTINGQNITFCDSEDDDAFAAESDDEILDLMGR